MKKYITNNGYVRVPKNASGERFEHRVVWEKHNGKIPKGMTIHHINGNKLDNKIENLSMLTHDDNMLKMDRAGKGFSLTKNFTERPYRAFRNIDKKQRYFGVFGTKCGAIMASRMAYITWQS